MSLRWRVIALLVVLGPALLWISGVGRNDSSPGGVPRATTSAPVPAPSSSEPPVDDRQPDGDMANQVGPDIEGTTVVRPTATARTDATDAEAADLQDAVRATIDGNGWTTATAIAADGYRPMAGDPSHWYRPATLRRDHVVDPTDPEFLVVVDDAVVAAMFVTDLDAPPDPPGAPLTEWHRHEWSAPVCLADRLVVVGVADGPCPPGAEANLVSPWMLHVWLDADEPFAAEMDGSGHQH